MSNSGVEANELNQRRPGSPTLENSAARTNASNLIVVANRIDPGAKISAVTKASDESTLVKIDPSFDIGTAKTLATLAAMRVAFPFASVTATESYSTGHTQFVVLLKTNTEDIRNAKQLYANVGLMQILKQLSNTLALVGLCTYAALLYASAIRPDQQF
jgi:predicted RecA/RadA family phage recombinase